MKDNKLYTDLETEQTRILQLFWRLANDNQLQIEREAELFTNLSKTKETDQSTDRFYRSLEMFKTLFSAREQERPFDKKEIQRIATILLPHSKRSKETAVQNTEDLFRLIFDYIESKEQTVHNEIKHRPLSLYYRYLSAYLDMNPETTSISLSEDDMPIIDRKENRVNNIYSIESLFYNDTPMSIDERRIPFRYNDRHTAHRSILKQTLEKSPVVLLDEKQDTINIELSKIISGKVSPEQTEFDKRFSYNRAIDKLTIDLTESATGIKAFGILQLLLTEGLLNEKTLLILDEPEAHLHPQWIVEYARIIVMLNKDLGVRFMIASHNPDMVSALRYISEKENTLQNLRFYLAEKTEDREQYNYKNLETDIEPVFQTFNIALDRINQYGI
ncbi:AAA ATPase domain-containing protein [Porphyromonadaceae bacterium NLAE-zl-C104]|nr:AAA ATPase domain-containing protein [Porphyromonadaceae bacterium NLAE-zl-C104]